MAMEGDNGIFVGWIKRQYLDNSDCTDGRKVVIHTVEDFTWKRGGGACRRGTVEVIEE
jgi:hypothetical protein